MSEMEQKKGTITRSFRIDEETAEKFKEISMKLGGNQQETMAKLVEAYEFQSGKAVIVEKRADIEKFESYVTILTRMYMDTLSDNQNITECVRTEFEALLKSKDETIMQLQSMVELSRRDVTELVEENERLENEKKQLESENEKINSELSEKSKINQNLMKTYDSLNEQISEYKQKLAMLDAMKENFNNMQTEHEEIKKENDFLREKNERLIEEYERKVEDKEKMVRFEMEKQILEIEKKHSFEILELQKQHQEELDIYNKKILSFIAEQNIKHN